MSNNYQTEFAVSSNCTILINFLIDIFAYKYYQCLLNR